MKNFTLLWLVIFLGGCADAAPNLIGGKYYMAGDSDCTSYRMLSESRIMCIKKDGTEMGYRDSMSDQELQMHMYRQQMNNNLNSTNSVKTCKRVGDLSNAVYQFSGYCPFGYY